MNYLLAVMDAVTYSVSTGSDQQLADGNATTLDTNIEQGEYNDWMTKVEASAANVDYWAKMVSEHPSDKSYQSQLTAAQTDYQNTETQEQTYTQQADSGTQAMQNQTGQDSSNSQQKVQLESAVNQVSQALSSALAQRY
jgi:hypothetical protein